MSNGNEYNGACLAQAVTDLVHVPVEDMFAFFDKTRNFTVAEAAMYCLHHGCALIYLPKPVEDDNYAYAWRAMQRNTGFLIIRYKDSPVDHALVIRNQIIFEPATKEIWVPRTSYETVGIGFITRIRSEERIKWI